jgi:hypothetical protein
MRSLSENWPGAHPVRSGMICECTRCRVRRADQLVERLSDQSLSTALIHAQHARAEELAAEAGRASTMTLKPINPTIRWSAPASVSDILAKRGPASLEDKGKRRVYRVTRDGREVYFGIVHGSNKSVADRIREHAANIGWTPAQRRFSESKQLAKKLEERRRTTFVRYADIPATRGYRADPKHLHAIELLLQNSLRPQIYIPQSLTFEDEAYVDQV